MTAYIVTVIEKDRDTRNEKAFHLQQAFQLLEMRAIVFVNLARK